MVQHGQHNPVKGGDHGLGRGHLGGCVAEKEFLQGPLGVGGGYAAHG